MVNTCCICKLTHGIVPDVSFHTIPKSEEVKLKWLAVIGQKVYKSSTVCSNHFDEGDFTYKVVGDNVKRFLLPKAVPVIHGHSDSESVQRQTMNPNNSDSNNVSIPKVDQSLISESKLTIDSHNNENESMESDESHESKFNIPSDKEINEIKQQNVLVAKKSSKNSDDDITLANQQDLTILKKSSLKRRSSDTQSLTSEKRVCNPRYLGDLTREDFTSDIAYATVKDYLNNQKKKQKVLNQKVRRLTEKVKSLQSLLDHFKKNGLITTEGSMALEDGTAILKSQIAKNNNEASCEPQLLSNVQLEHDYVGSSRWMWSEYSHEFVIYIAGAIVRSIKKKIKCKMCLEQLEDDNLLSSRLLKLKNRATEEGKETGDCCKQTRGDLTSPSNDVVTICKTAEKVIRSTPNLHSENVLQKLMINAKLLLATVNVFPHMGIFIKHTVEKHHKLDLMNLILKKYFNMRLRHEATCLQDSVQQIRSYHNRIVVSKNQ